MEYGTEGQNAAADKREDTKLLESQLLRMMRRLKQINLNLFSEQIVYQEYQALLQLHECGETGGMKSSQLAQRLGIAPSALSRMLNGMEGRRLIQRRVDPSDRRNVLLTLTDQGEQTRSEIYQRLSAVRERMIRRMGEANVKEMIRLGNRLADLLEDELAQRRGDKERMELDKTTTIL